MSYIILHIKGLSKIPNIRYILYVTYCSTQKGVVKNTEHHLHILCLHYSTQKGVVQITEHHIILYITYYSTQKGGFQKTEQHKHIVYQILFYTERDCPKN